ncbi:AsnC family protein [Amycolatopsis antarctica]|uniref:AsnC family protein n=1 Tax=Amycolatopsis antarctica TaxID=1854586 RepID=A0A263DAH7_9PSEU|nr:AsnC family protein [Amycolatopsis antarctica]OZM74527.1 AsnC family protein [Amycolatopsis antarctica]
MAVTDPVDARLLAALAEQGKAAVHELAAKVGMDPREVAYRLVALSGSGLPLLVGVECDPQGVRAAVSGSRAPQQQPAQQPQQQQPPAQPQQVRGAPSGAYPVGQHTPGPQHVHGLPSGSYQVQGVPSGAYPVHGAPSGSYTVQGAPPGQQGRPAQIQQPYPPQQYARPPAPHHQVTQGPAPQGHTPPAQVRPDPVMSTWGPPQSASWARGDQRPAEPAPAQARAGRSGDVLETHGLEGEQLAIQLLEVQDPADFLFSAAGYRLDDGERAVVVHTEITNRGAIPFASLPDNYLELVAADGTAIGKAPVSLSSRPPHRIGVRPGETAGGHTVYVLPDATRVVSVRWNARPDSDERSVTWSLDD